MSSTSQPASGRRSVLRAGTLILLVGAVVLAVVWIKRPSTPELLPPEPAAALQAPAPLAAPEPVSAVEPPPAEGPAASTTPPAMAPAASGPAPAATVEAAPASREVPLAPGFEKMLFGPPMFAALAGEFRKALAADPEDPVRGPQTEQWLRGLIQLHPQGAEVTIHSLVCRQTRCELQMSRPATPGEAGGPALSALLQDPVFQSQFEGPQFRAFGKGDNGDTLIYVPLVRKN